MSTADPRRSADGGSGGEQPSAPPRLDPEALARRARTLRTLAACGMLAPARPDRLARTLRALRDWGPTIAAGVVAGAARSPEAAALVDERGELTFADLDRRTNALARAWREDGLAAGDRVAILCRNHGGFVEATVACAKLGAHALLLNTELAGPQLGAVCARERPRAIVLDGDVAGAGAAAAAVRGSRRYVAWSGDREGGSAGGRDRAGAGTLEALAERGDGSDLPPPAAHGRMIVLTSGTTGAPKGAIRRQPTTLDPLAALLERIPLRARERTHVAAPLFHSWGLAHLAIALGLGSTLVLRRRFDAEGALRALDEHGCTALVLVPAMLGRILELGPRALARHDTGALRVIASSGSALPGDLALRAIEAFGDVLYNLYGTTEAAWATIATPSDLRAAPGTAGRPPRGTVVRLLDAGGREVERGERGRIFVGGELAFEGYTGGGGRELVDGLLATGDIGHLDAEGRLFVDGREDEMIVSGGENVFPREVEDAICALPGVAEAAAVGVEDADFGQRLRAFVVPAAGASPSEREIQDHVRRSLARFKVPREVVFVDALPRTATGKVLRRELGRS